MACRARDPRDGFIRLTSPPFQGKPKGQVIMWGGFLDATRLEEFKERCVNGTPSFSHKIEANMMNLASLAPESFDGNCKRRVIEKN